MAGIRYIGSAKSESAKKPKTCLKFTFVPVPTDVPTHDTNTHTHTYILLHIINKFNIYIYSWYLYMIYCYHTKPITSLPKYPHTHTICTSPRVTSKLINSHAIYINVFLTIFLYISNRWFFFRSGQSIVVYVRTYI